MAIKSSVSLANGVILGISAASLYTVPGTLNRISVSLARLVNYSGAPVNVTIYVLQNGEAVANERKALDNITLAAGETRIITEIIQQAINSGGSIQGFASVATSVSFSLTGVQFDS